MCRIPNTEDKMLSQDRCLDLTSFFLADVRDGLGPFLSIYLANEHSLSPSSIGLILSICHFIGLSTKPLSGFVVDRTDSPRGLIIGASLVITASCLSVPFIRSVPMHIFLQGMSRAVAGVISPAMASLSLSMSGGGKEFDKRVGRNEMWNHAGNASAALLAGVFSVWSDRAIFWIMAFNAFCAVVAIFMVHVKVHKYKRDQDIDTDKADASHDRIKSEGGLLSLWKVGAENGSLVVFAVCLALFHLGNAAMLPLVGQKLSAVYGAEYATMFTSSTIVGAQFVMAPVSRFVGSNADTYGRRPFLLFAFAALTLRGILLSLHSNMYYVLTVQLLDGLGAGTLDTLLPLVVRDLVDTKHDTNQASSKSNFGATLGSIMTMQGIAGGFSGYIAGYIVEYSGFDAAFLALGMVAAVALGVLMLCMPETRRVAKKVV